MCNGDGILELRRTDGTLTYEITGNGNAGLVCVPSIGDLKEEYRFLTPKLVSAGYKVITMDIRGIGDSSTTFKDYSAMSMGSDILSLIDSTHKNAPAWVVGCSLSASSAVWAASRSPDKIAGIILISPAIRNAPIPLGNRILYNFALRAPWGAGLWTNFYRSLYKKNPPEDFQDYLRKLKSNLSEKGRMRAVRLMTFSPKEECVEALGKVKCPAMAIFGSRDPDFKDPVKEMEWLKSKFEVETEVIDDVGHYPHVETPHEIATKILQFIKSSEK